MQYYTKFMDFMSNLPQLFTSVFGQVWATVRYQVKLEGTIDILMLLVIGVILFLAFRKIIKYIKSDDADEEVTYSSCIVFAIVFLFYMIAIVSWFRPSLTKMMNPDYQTIIQIQKLCK